MVKTTKLRELPQCTGFPAGSTTRIWQPQSSSDTSSDSAPWQASWYPVRYRSSRIWCKHIKPSKYSSKLHRILTIFGPHSESQQFPRILILVRSRTETIQEPPMKLAFFNFKFGIKWIDYWLKELEERGNAQKRTLAILLWIYSVSITIEKSGRHWLMCEYCSHEAAACIDDDIKKVVERLLRDIWVHTQGQESVSGEWQETFLFSWYHQIQNDSGRWPPLFRRNQVRASSNSETSSNC